MQQQQPQQQQPRANDQFRKAIGKLVRGLEKRNQEQHDRRRHHRFNFGTKVSLCVNVGEDNFNILCDAWAMDLSIGGMGFITEQSIDDDTLIYASFEELMGKPCYIPLKIRRCARLIGNIYQIHSQFAYPDEMEENPLV